MKTDSIKDRVSALQREFKFTPPLAAALERAMQTLLWDAFGELRRQFNPVGGSHEQVQRERGPPQATPDAEA
jgi:hypothetical protein